LERCPEECYAGEGGTSGWLGFPVSKEEENAIGDFVRRFEGGAIYSASLADDGDRAFAVRPEVTDALGGQVFFPISKESATAESPYGTSGQVQRFQVNLEAGRRERRETTVYSCESYGVVVVAQEVWSYYYALGSENSWLGFPARGAAKWLGREYRSQEFEQGMICWHQKSKPIAVPYWGDSPSSLRLVEFGKLGSPVSEQQPIGNGPDRIQFFENGNVTLRDGKREIWLRPNTRDFRCLITFRVLLFWRSVRVFVSVSCLRAGMAGARVSLRVGVRFHGPRPRGGGAVSLLPVAGAGRWLSRSQARRR
jgi:hypothetical protein